MSKKEDKFNALLNAFKEEQKNRFKEEQKKYDEKLIIINKKMAEQNKKHKRAILFVMFICLFVSGITSVLSYTLGASSVEYTPRDSSWNVENAQEAIDDLFNSVGAALVGSVYSYMGVSAPYGYLACDGSVYNIEDYPRLANHINRSFGKYNYFGGDGSTTFAVPDLRGEFLRGSGTNSHSYQGSGSTVGTHQDATEHIRTIGNTSSGQIQIQADTGTGPWSYPRNVETTRNYGQHYFLNVSGSKGTDSNYTYYSARPTNTSVLYIIKY